MCLFKKKSFIIKLFSVSNYYYYIDNSIDLNPNTNSQ